MASTESGFFTKSLFRSAYFCAMSLYAALLALACGAVLIKYWTHMSSLTAVSLLLLMYQGPIGWIWRVIDEHGRISEQLASNQAREIPSESILASALDLAARGLQFGMGMNLISMTLTLLLVLNILGHRI
jgi:hypothetical protein